MQDKQKERGIAALRPVSGKEFRKRQADSTALEATIKSIAKSLDDFDV